MFRNREDIRRRLFEVVERFREKGATSPEKAMTIQELGLPPRFEQAMHRRLGQTGIFVEVNGKYYLNEERLKQIQEQRAKEGSRSSEGSGSNRVRPPTSSRIVGTLLMLPIGIIIAFVLVYFAASRGAYFPGEFLIILLVIFLGLFVVRLLFWRSRRRHWREELRENEALHPLGDWALVSQKGWRVGCNAALSGGFIEKLERMFSADATSSF